MREKRFRNAVDIVVTRVRGVGEGQLDVPRALEMIDGFAHLDRKLHLDLERGAAELTGK